MLLPYLCRLIFQPGILVASYPNRYDERTCIVNQEGKLLVAAISSRVGKVEKINNRCKSLAGIEVNNYTPDETKRFQKKCLLPTILGKVCWQYQLTASMDM